MPQRPSILATPRSRLGGDWLDLGFVRTVLLQQKLTFLGFFLAVCGVTLAGSLLAEEQYEAQALIHLLPNPGREVQVDEVVSSGVGGYMEARERARTQIEIIQSRAVREEVVRRYSAMGYDDLEATPEGLAALGEALSAAPREDTQLVEIRVRHPDPERAALLANLFAHVYREDSLDERRETAREARDWLEGREDEYKQALDAANQALIEFKLANDVVDIDEAVTSTGARLASLQEALSRATTDRLVLEASLVEHQDLLKQGQADVLTGLFDDPALRALAQERAQVVTDAAQVLARYGEQHPEHKKVMAQIASIDELVLAEVRRNVEAERVRVTMLRNQEHRLEKELQLLKDELAHKQRLQQQYDELKLEQQRAMRFYGELGERGSEVDLQSRTRLSQVRIVDEALPPAAPASPNVPLNLAVGAGVGLLGGFGLALLRYRGDEVIETAADVEAVFCEPPLGVLPTFPFARRQADRLYYSFDHPRSLLAAALRGAAGVLSGLLPGERPVCIVVSSSTAAEGKTTVATGLGIAWARAGKRVVVVECELEKHDQHNAFRLHQGQGLAEALDEPTRVGAMVRTTRVKGLHVLPGGRDPGADNGRLANKELSQVIGALSRSHDVVILDMSRQVMLDPARAVVAASDGVVIVIRRGLVSRTEVARTLDGLRMIGGRRLGIVLNDVHDGSPPAPIPPPTAPADGQPPAA